MKKDVEPKNKKCYLWYEWLKRENARMLRKSGHKAPGTNERKKRIRKSFNNLSHRDAEIKHIGIKPFRDGEELKPERSEYWQWLEAHNSPEPPEANPDSLPADCPRPDDFTV
jgi:hypothetical protein